MTAAALDSPHRRAAEPPSVEAHSAGQQIQPASRGGGSAGTEPPPAGTLDRRCRHCRGPIPEKNPHKTGSKPSYCSEDCRKDAATERQREARGLTAGKAKSCQRCGGEIVGRGGAAKFCGDDCAEQAKVERYRARMQKQAAAPAKPKRRRFKENPEWQAPDAEVRRRARRVELDGRLRRIEQDVASRFREQRQAAL